jgi:hypothetical protein
LIEATVLIFSEKAVVGEESRGINVRRDNEILEGVYP